MVSYMRRWCYMWEEYIALAEAEAAAYATLEALAAAREALRKSAGGGENPGTVPKAVPGFPRR